VLDEEPQLIEKVRKIEGLFTRPGTEGERLAAESASHRIRARGLRVNHVQRASEQNDSCR
jgi:hypothetical protein